MKESHALYSKEQRAQTEIEEIDRKTSTHLPPLPEKGEHCMKELKRYYTQLCGGIFSHHIHHLLTHIPTLLDEDQKALPRGTTNPKEAASWWIEYTRTTLQEAEQHFTHATTTDEAQYWQRVLIEQYVRLGVYHDLLDHLTTLEHMEKSTPASTEELTAASLIQRLSELTQWFHANPVKTYPETWEREDQLSADLPDGAYLTYERKYLTYGVFSKMPAPPETEA
jgi:hypothetical protein